MITEDIIKQAQAGSSEAFAIIYNETVKTAYYVAKRILLDDDATEDVLQEAYIAVFKNLSNYQTGNIQGWIDTIVANRAKNYLRTKNPILFSEMETEENPVVEFEEEKIEFRPDEKVDYSETQRLILEIVDNLSPEQRLAVMLFYFEERSVKEIAEICECSENTVKSRLNYARKKIKEDVLELEKKGTKLYSISIIPFIIWMLSEKAKVAEISEGMSTKIFAGVSSMVTTGEAAAASATVTASASAEAGATVAASASAEAAASVSAGASVVGTTSGIVTKAVVTKVGMTLGAKITVGIVAAVVTAGVVVGGIAIKNNVLPKEDNENGRVSTEEFSDISGTNNSEINSSEANNSEADNPETNNVETDNSETNNTVTHKPGIKNEEITKLPYEGGYLTVASGDGQTYVLINGNETTTLEDDIYGNIHWGYYLLWAIEGIGLKHIDGRIIVEPGTYDEMRWLDGYLADFSIVKYEFDLLEVKKNNKSGVINTKGEIVIPVEHDIIRQWSSSSYGKKHLILVAEKTNEDGELVSTAYRGDGTKLLEVTGESINGSDFEFQTDMQLYVKRGDDINTELLVMSTKTGEVFFDCVKDGITDVTILSYIGLISYEDGSQKTIAFNEDYTAYEEVILEFGSCAVFVTDNIYSLYKGFYGELEFYVNHSLEKTIENVESAWVHENDIYYIVNDLENNGYKSLCNQDGEILRSDEYTWYYDSYYTKRYIIVKANNETTYQLFDLVNKEVVVTGIVKPEYIDGTDYWYVTWELEGDNRVTVWLQNSIVTHSSDKIVNHVGEDYAIFTTQDGANLIITDMKGNATFEFSDEIYRVYHELKVVVADDYGSNPKYYDFNGELLYSKD